MGAQYSNLVFKVAENSSYTEQSLRGLTWIEDAMQDGRKVPTVYHEWKGRNGESAYFTILYSSGNTEDMGDTQAWVSTIKDVLHVNVICYDYSGYGINRQNKPSEKNCYDDILAVYNYLTFVKEIPSERIILMGKNLGSGPTLHLASTLYANGIGDKRSFSKSIGKMLGKRLSVVPGLFKGFGGIILMTPFTSVLDLNSDVSNLQSALIPDMFENTKRISKVKCPFAIAHGANDEIIPCKHSQKLSKLVPEGFLQSYVEIQGANYMNMDSDFSDDVLEEFFKFVESLTPPEFLQERKQSISQIPLRFTSSPIQQITSWLKPLNMDKYAEKFVEFGFYDPLALLSIMTDDLLLMGVEDKQEQQIILEAVKALTEKKEEKSPEKKDENANSAIFSPYRTRSAHAKPPVAEIFSPKTKLQKSKSLADVEEAELNGGEVSPVPSTPSTPAPALPESVESRPRGYDNTKYKSGDISKFKQAIVNFRRSSEPSSEAALNPPNIVSQTEQIERLLKRLDLVERTGSSEPADAKLAEGNSTNAVDYRFTERKNSNFGRRTCKNPRSSKWKDNTYIFK